MGLPGGVAGSHAHCAGGLAADLSGVVLGRLDWIERASAIGAYRALYGIETDTDPSEQSQSIHPRPDRHEGCLLRAVAPGPVRD